MGKHCSGVFFWIYTIFSLLLIFHVASAFYEYNNYGDSQKYYSSVASAILLTIVLGLACIHSRITYIILIVIYGIIVILEILGIVLYSLSLAAAVANENTRKDLNQENVTAAIILLCIKVFFALFQFTVLRLFYIAFKYYL